MIIIITKEKIKEKINHFPKELIMKDLNTNVSLICRICGNNLFSALGHDGEEFAEFSEVPYYKCSDCGRLISKNQLIEENQETINANIEEIKKEAVDEMKKELQKSFGKIGKIR